MGDETVLALKKDNHNYNQDDLDPLHLLQQLEVARQYIKDLEVRLEKREEELRVSRVQSEKSFRRKSRRQGLVSPSNVARGILQQQMGSPERESTTGELGDYIQLTICGFDTLSPDVEDITSIPFCVRFLKGNTYVIGPDGVTIGCATDCGIKLPSDTKVFDYHSMITSTEAENGKREFCVVNCLKSKFQMNKEDTDKSAASSCYVLHSESCFHTGVLQWRVSAVPQNKLIQSQLFSSIRKVDYKLFQEIFDNLKELVALQDIEAASVERKGDDVVKQLNFLEDKNYCIVRDSNIIYSENGEKFHVTNTDDRNEKYSLLHVAVDYGCIDIVECLLKQGVKVDMQCGSKLMTPLHIAARQSSKVVVMLLLNNGADIDKTDSNGFSALAMAESYPIRHILLSASLLCAACFGGDTVEVNRLLTDKCACINVKGYRGYTPLQLACMNGHYDIAESLLQNSAAVDGRGGIYDRTSLHLVSITDNVRVAELLMKYDAHPSVVDATGYTPLDLSCSREMCQLLSNNKNSLCLAVQSNDLVEVKRLLDENILERNIILSPDQLHKRLSNGQHGRRTSRQMILKNLGLCALVDQKNEKNFAPIHLAAASGNKDMVHLLLSYGAKLDIQGGLEKWTALFFSALAGHSDCTHFLLMVGSDDSYCDARGLLCIDQVENNIKILKNKLTGNAEKLADIECLIPDQFLNRLDKKSCFLDTNAEIRHRLQCLSSVVNVLHSGQQKLLNALQEHDMNTLNTLLCEEEVNVNGILCKTLPITALCYAASIGMDDATKLLLEYNADPYGADGQSYTSIHTAADCGHANIVKILLNHGVDVNIQTKLQSYTPLHIAALKCHKDIVEMLLVSGSDVAIKDRSGKTAFELCDDVAVQSVLARGDEELFVAVKTGDIAYVSKLLERIDVNCRFMDQLTPLHVAAGKGYVELCELLIAKGAVVNVQGGVDLSSPLHCTARSFSSDLISLLVEHDADLTLQDIDGKTPFEVSGNQSTRRALFNARKILTKPTLIDCKNDVNNTDLMDKCRICLTEPVDTVVMPCGHRSFCSDCVLKLEECALDRRPILDVIPLS